MVRVLLFLCALMIAAHTNSAFALSEYGDFCETNSNCLACRDDAECIICIHNCENRYGAADGFSLFLGNRDRDPEAYKEACRLTLAKWCQAQCWDPDDVTGPSTKPSCNVHVDGEHREGGRIFWKEKATIE